MRGRQSYFGLPGSPQKCSWIEIWPSDTCLMATNWKSIIAILSSGKDKLLHRWYKIPLGKQRHLLASPCLWNFLRELHTNRHIIRRVLWTDELLCLRTNTHQKKKGWIMSYFNEIWFYKLKNQLCLSISEIKYFYFHYFYKNSTAVWFLNIFSKANVSLQSCVSKVDMKVTFSSGASWS